MLKLFGDTITTNSLKVRALVYRTRDNGSIPSWENMGKFELLLCYDILGCILLMCGFVNVYVLFFSTFILLIFVGFFY